MTKSVSLKAHSIEILNKQIKSLLIIDLLLYQIQTLIKLLSFVFFFLLFFITGTSNQRKNWFFRKYLEQHIPGPGIPKCECLQDEGWIKKITLIETIENKSSIFLLVKLQCRRILWEHSKELGVWSEETPKETENQSEQRRVRTYKICDCISVF